MVRKTFTFILLFLFASSFSFADAASDPNDKLYDYLEIWENHGYLKNLPLLRPYPAQLLIKLLKEVSIQTSGEDKKTAERYLKKLDSPFLLELGAEHTNRFSGDSYLNETGINVGIGSMISPAVSLSGNANVYLLKTQGKSTYPLYTRTTKDILPDWADAEIFGTQYKVRQGVNSTVAFGSDTLYFQLGLFRSSFGPFFDDGAVISPTAPQTGHFSFTWRYSDFTFTAALLELTASDNTGASRYPGKYLALHSLNLYPNKWIQVGFFETVVYGGRFEPLYLIPLSEYFYLQGVLGFPDNSLLGVNTTINTPYDLAFNFLLYADDLHFDDLIKFNFDTKYKLSLQAGLSWFPLTKEIDKLSLDYILVTPYMYTHQDLSPTTPANYLNYTQMGENLGPDLEPNSDRVRLLMRTAPFTFMDMDLVLRYIRHGNGSVEGSTNVGGGDGTIFDDGYNGGIPTFQNTTRFMTQDIIERTFQLGVSTNLKFKFPQIKIDLALNYTFEYITNKNLSTDSETNNIFQLTVNLQS